MLEYFEEGILTTLIGMGVVFSVLIVLSLMIKWLNSGVNAAMGRKPKNEEINISQSEQAPAKPEMKKNQSISPAVVAAITATICALTGKTAEEFKFTEIRRVSHESDLCMVQLRAPRILCQPDNDLSKGEIDNEEI
jgi:sodium pump decarboxylase gamma subunit